MTFPAPRSVCTYALHIAKAKNLRVFPVVERGTQPRSRNWWKVATVSEWQIDRWFIRDCWHCNFGIVTDGLIILSVEDWSNPGRAAELLHLEKNHGSLPPTFAICTGEGGVQFVFRNSGPSLPTGVRLSPHIYTYADGGFIVGPGSTHPCGKRYEILADIETAEGPGWLKDLIQERAAVSGGLDGC